MPRVDLSARFPVFIKAALNSGRGELLNLSEGGAYIATTMALLPQAQLRLRVALPEENRWIELEGVVTWENRGPRRLPGRPPGYGVRFTKIPKKSVDTIRQLLRSAEAPSVPAPSAAAAATPEPAAPSVAPPPVAKPAPAPAPTLQMEETENPPFRLSEDRLAVLVPEKSRGVFVLYYDRTQEARVGRGDQDLRATLAQFIGTYGYFWHELLETVEECYRRECQLYHHYGGDRRQLDTSDHPMPPPEIEPPECLECGALVRPEAASG
jgi:uncharacterized protein (TIGR02266 family)